VHLSAIPRSYGAFPQATAHDRARRRLGTLTFG
jgi:hypothetical protein